MGELSQAEAFARIRLLRSPNVGPITYAQLLRRFGNAIEAVAALPELAGRKGKVYSGAPELIVQQEIAHVRKARARYLFHDSPEYPDLLRRVDSAPPILVIRGDVTCLAKPCVSMVGARNASAGAMRIAREIAYDLAAEGWTIVSGLARGIDRAAHQGALASGQTIGVIASGIDVTYPPEHAQLQEEVANRGLLLAEQPPGTEPLARHFPARNRIIAGLSVGTLIVEAAPKSGSLITARLAGEMGREVMAIPGSPLDSRSQGGNQLIRDGAILVQNASDVIELLSSFTGQPRTLFREVGAPFSVFSEGEDEAFCKVEADDASTSATVQNLLTTAPVTIDELIRQSGQSAGGVHMALLELELTGALIRHAGGRVSLR